MAQSDKPPPVSQTNQNLHANIAAQAANNSDSLSSLTLSQGMWFTTMTTQLCPGNPTEQAGNADFPPAINHYGTTGDYPNIDGGPKTMAGRV